MSKYAWPVERAVSARNRKAWATAAEAALRAAEAEREAFEAAFIAARLAGASISEATARGEMAVRA